MSGIFWLRWLIRILAPAKSTICPARLAFPPSQWINPIQRIRCILIKVIAPQQPNRILMNKPPDIGIVIAEAVVVQACFGVVPLALKADALVGDFAPYVWLIGRFGGQLLMDLHPAQGVGPSVCVCQLTASLALRAFTASRLRI